jgi:hypothetical protein
MAARKAPHLRDATKEAAPEVKKTAMTVTKAADSGDRRELLVAMRARVARDVENPNTPARDLAALTRRLLEIAKDIEALDLAAVEDARDKASRDHDDEAFDASAV